MIESKGDFVVWLILAVNFICFCIITISYISIVVITKRSSQSSEQESNAERLRDQKIIENKVTIIVVTDFLCWVPFIIISALHNLKTIDATHWYATLAMIVLPINSVINPLIYDDRLRRFTIDILTIS